MINDYATHIPALSSVLCVTDGDVIECGIGDISLPFLAGALRGTGRSLWSFEDAEEYLLAFRQFDQYEHVSLRHVPKWDMIEKFLKDDVHYGVAFIDNCPPGKENEYKDRKVVAEILKDRVDVLVIHDADSEWFTMDPEWNNFVKSFKIIRTWLTIPSTLVLSNEEKLIEPLRLIVPTW